MPVQLGTRVGTGVGDKVAVGSGVALGKGVLVDVGLGVGVTSETINNSVMELVSCELSPL